MCSSSKSILGVTSIDSGAAKATEPSAPHMLEIGLLMVCNKKTPTGLPFSYTCYLTTLSMKNSGVREKQSQVYSAVF